MMNFRNAWYFSVILVLLKDFDEQINGVRQEPL